MGLNLHNSDLTPIFDLLNNQKKNNIMTASKFFEYTRLNEMGKFITEKLKFKSVADLKQLEMQFNAANGCTLVYPAVLPLTKKREETGWDDSNGGHPTYSMVTYDSLNGIVKVEHE